MRIKSIILVFTIIIFSNLTGQEKINLVRDTSLISANDSVAEKNSGKFKDQQIQKSEYYELLEKVLDNKQQFYDSTLNNLNFWSATVGALIAFLTLLFVVLSFAGFSRIRDIRLHIEEGLDRRINSLVTDKYEPDITDLRRRLFELEDKSRSGNTQYIPKHEFKNPFEQGENDPKKNEEPVFKGESAASENPFDFSYESSIGQMESGIELKDETEEKDQDLTYNIEESPSNRQEAESTDTAEDETPNDKPSE